MLYFSVLPQNTFYKAISPAVTVGVISACVVNTRKEVLVWAVWEAALLNGVEVGQPALCVSPLMNR